MGEKRPSDEALRVVELALDEDHADRDVTTLAVADEAERGWAVLVARQDCVISGLVAFQAAFSAMGDPAFEISIQDGQAAKSGTIVAQVTGSIRNLLAAERVALNFVQRLSGVATLTRAYVAAAGSCQIRDTRKTTPGMRLLEKAAVVHGGGTNHRLSLADKVLIKDNHLVVAGGIAPAIQAVRARFPDIWIEIECDTIEQVEEAAAQGVDEILLDNMDIATLQEAVTRIAGRCRTEASGGITLERIAAIASTGVDAISVGALTHSAPAIDLTLEISSTGGT